MLQYIRNHPAFGLVVGVGLLLISAFAIWRQAAGRTVVDPGDAFFTTDEGATLFKDSAEHVPPFDHDGKPAVRAAVFSCDKGQHQWVQYLLKYPQEAIDAAEEFKSKGKKLVPADAGLVKRPGDKKWVPMNDGRAIMTPGCPDGQAGVPQEIRP